MTTSAPTSTWFITGASSGFGRAFAEHALAQGHNVVATARDPGKLADLVALAPSRVLACALDVDALGAAEDAVKAAIARFGRIDVLINNAGYGVVGALEETPDAELRALMNTNFFGAIAVTRAALPFLRAQRSGAIVNISSLGGQLSFAGFSAYSATKFAIEGASEALAQEAAPFGIKVLIVEPGQFRTQLAGSGMRHMPVIEDYQPVVGGTREFARTMHNTQAGDPRKAAAAIERALKAEHTPLRLQLGGDAVDAVRAHAQALLKEMGEWESVARGTDFDSETPEA
ncbi:oxidoreductase [Variovorax sp. Sphag1AA]|uniref:oxidoreductase n=1 Tax=Variovorax sp. Sphag1AA TaxID=2587027 RepID=UPI00160CE71B|nr:oxidoreductase [Variovorax sp. Sphag1AA]MBB3178506.1 NAD(P)-dependent dehydrogenase (short-subunit alcohol dehydrogenase family) [Variovorax sp. Sphag1AA]